MADRSRRLVPKLSQVIAEREYSLVTGARRPRKVHLRFGKPRPLPDRAGYHCVYQIEGLDEGGAAATTRTAWAGGVDGVQALDLAMKMALVWLVDSKAYAEGRLTWDGAHDLGLPVIEQIRAQIKKGRDAGREAEEVRAELAALREHARQPPPAPRKPARKRR